jgi:hypothetical protein
MKYSTAVPFEDLIYATVGITWLITLGGGGGGEQNQPWVLGTSQSSQVRKRRKIGLNQSFIYIYIYTPLSPTLTPILCAPLQLSSHKKLLPPAQITPVYAP